MNLNQVTVPVSDVERSIAFYKQLGLRLIVHSQGHYARFECPEGDATFSLHHVPELPVGNGVWVYFEFGGGENLDQYVEALVKSGIEFDEMPEDRSWLWREARLKDPDGNQIILFYGGENRKNPPWKLSTSTTS
ncbi:MAG: VOC family protein [Bacteroidia bacterium]